MRGAIAPRSSRGPGPLTAPRGARTVRCVDEDLHRLERAFEAAPDDVEVALRLARTSLRVGRAARALAISRVAGECAEREDAARAVGAALGLAWLGTFAGQDRFQDLSGTTLVLVPGGAFLDDGAAGEVSSLLERTRRADLRRVVLPDLLAAVEPELEDDREAAKAAAARRGGRLPTPVEWKKLWRGGIWLDGDLAARDENPSPDRMLPSLERVPDNAVVESPYGLRFDLAATEWTFGQGELGGVFDQSTWRYHISVATPADRRGRMLVWRLVRDLPPA